MQRSFIKKRPIRSPHRSSTSITKRESSGRKSCSPYKVAFALVMATFWGLVSVQRVQRLNAMLEEPLEEDRWTRHSHLLNPHAHNKTRCSIQSTECTCPEDPTLATVPQDSERSLEHHKRLVRSARSAASNVDGVLLGDSIVERWNGTKFQGTVELPKPYRAVFGSFFSRQGGGALEGLALGAGGETSQNLLWHLQNGTLPESLRPKVWWILIGTNDLANNLCFPDYVVAGILSVVKYVQTQRPATPIILHGLLPRTDVLGKQKEMRLGRNWAMIKIINDRLRAFCESHPNVHYMDSVEVFLLDTERIDKTLMDDGLHPNTKGFRKWGPLVVEEIQQVMNMSGSGLV